MVEGSVERRWNPWLGFRAGPVLTLSGGDPAAGVGAALSLGRSSGVRLLLEPILVVTGEPSVWSIGIATPDWRGLHATLFTTTAGASQGVGRLLEGSETPRLGVSIRATPW